VADLRKWLKDNPKLKVRPKDHKLPEVSERELHPDEQRALYKLQREARQNRATLHGNGKGGLPPSLVLGVLRRDKFTCVECGLQQDLQVHHKAGIVSSKKLSKMGHQNTLEGIETICRSCHDKVHDKARKKGIDSSQVLAEGDKGTKYDHGQPLANPPR